jgi:hypothetical protein
MVALTERLKRTVGSSRLSEHDALRRALLHCLVLLENSDDVAARQFSDFLLNDFRALVDQFSGGRHPYIGTIPVAKTRHPDGRMKLALPLQLVAKELQASR